MNVAASYFPSLERHTLRLPALIFSFFSFSSYFLQLSSLSASSYARYRETLHLPSLILIMHTT